ncbi:hypothetical protein [Bacillus tropicus]
MAYVLEVVGQDKVAGVIASWSCNWYYGCNLSLTFMQRHVYSSR